MAGSSSTAFGCVLAERRNLSDFSRCFGLPARPGADEAAAADRMLEEVLMPPGGPTEVDLAVSAPDPDGDIDAAMVTNTTQILI